MKFGKVLGNIISTRNEGNIEGLKLMVVRYLNEKLEETQKTTACINAVNANPGDVVLLCSSSSARMTKLTRYVCTDNTIVAIVDSVSSDKKDWYHRDFAE